MLVKDFMTTDVVTVREDQSMLEAREILRGKNLISLPVVDDIKRIRGIITIDDIGKASPSESSTLSRYEANYLLGRLKVKDVMGRNVSTVEEDDTIEYVAYKMNKSRVNALPVLGTDGKLIGIITRSDMFRAFVEIMGVNIISLAALLNNDGTAEITIRCNLNNNGMDVIEKIREAGYPVEDIMTLDGLE